jgi:hypothetical protein|nr:hypothetical protein Q903MT_gene4551 [Picea sitchensis]
MQHLVPILRANENNIGKEKFSRSPLSYVEPLTSKEVPRAIEFGSHVLTPAPTKLSCKFYILSYRTP